MSTATMAGGLGGLQTDILAGSTHSKSDLRLIARAIREGWDIPADKKPEVVARLLETVEKRAVTVMTADGALTLDGPADANAIRAAAVLVSMDSLNQTDHWNADKNSRLDAGLATERVGVGDVVLQRPVVAVVQPAALPEPDP